MDGNYPTSPGGRRSTRQSPYSPFPFGSPIGTSDRSLLSPRVSTQIADNSSSLVRGRVRAQEAYGGPIIFGGHSSLRRTRLLAASPYAAAAAASRRPPYRRQSATPSPAASPSPSSTTSDGGGNSSSIMSTTAKLILDTLDRMSTPIRDAQKLIPALSTSSPPRAERRRMIAEQLDCRSSSSSKRKRPRLGNNSGVKGHLNGPPLRTVMSPVTTTANLKSARLSRVPEVVVAAVTAPDKTTTPTISRTVCTTSDTIRTTFNSFNNSSTSSPSGGKIRTKVTTTAKAKTNIVVDKINERPAKKDPITSFLAAHNTSLPIKGMPSIDLTTTCGVKHVEKKSDSQSVSRASTASTVILTPPNKRSQLEEVAAKVTKQETFSFSEPSTVMANNDAVGEEQHLANGILFSFCSPDPVADNNTELSSSSSFTMSPVKGSNHVPIPDLTASLRRKDTSDKVSQLKAGSVLDILGNHRLPDVTASAGIKVASELKQASVLSILGGGGTNPEDSWDPKFKMGTKPWH